MKNWHAYYLKFIASLALSAAAGYISYRAYMRNIDNSVQPLPLDEVNKMNIDASSSVFSLDFSKHKDKLKDLPLVQWDDDLDKIIGGFFMFKNYVFCIRKYQQTQKYHYSVFTEGEKMTQNNQSVKELTTEFITALKLDDVTITWENDHWN